MTRLQKPARRQQGRGHRRLTFIQVRVRQAAAELLDDVDGVQVPGALQPDDGVHRQLGEVVFVMSQQFGGQRRPGDVQEVLLETGGVVAMEEKGSRSAENERKSEEEEVSWSGPVVGRRLPQGIARRLRGLPPARDDGLWVNLLRHQKLRLLLNERPLM